MQSPFKYIILLGSILLACGSQQGTSSSQKAQPAIEPSKQWKEYWYNGQAEITSYEIKQARYGEIREGEAVLVFVTEPFSLQSMTKADRSNSTNISTLKCNFTKRFNTGIYPYSVMTSTFTPVLNPMNSPKITHSMQEWCGHVFMEYTRPTKTMEIRSYFEGENSDADIGDVLCENDLWASLRISPDNIPTGKTKMVPAFDFLRFRHLAAKAYDCEIKLSRNNKLELLVTYPSINRSLKIVADLEFPHGIISWEEKYPSGFGSSSVMTSTGKRIKTIRSDYWNRNRNSDEGLRDTLGLRY